jgi:hypothetical protein
METPATRTDAAAAIRAVKPPEVVNDEGAPLAPTAAALDEDEESVAAPAAANNAERFARSLAFAIPRITEASVKGRQRIDTVEGGEDDDDDDDEDDDEDEDDDVSVKARAVYPSAQAEHDTPAHPGVQAQTPVASTHAPWPLQERSFPVPSFAFPIGQARDGAPQSSGQYVEDNEEEDEAEEEEEEVVAASPASPSSHIPLPQTPVRTAVDDTIATW